MVPVFSNLLPGHHGPHTVGVTIIWLAALLGLGTGSSHGQTPIYSLFGQAYSQFGISVAHIGDMDLDGYADFVVGARANNPNDLGYAQVYSGRNGTVLLTVFGTGSFGGSVSGAGDVDADGVPDIIVGALLADNGGNNNGSAHVYSGSTGQEIHLFVGDSSSDNLGVAVSFAGDVDGDGYSDLIVGSSFDAGKYSGSGSAKVFAGVDGSLKYTLYGTASGDHFGISVSGAGDVNGDGYDDVMAGSWDGEYVRVFSGYDGSLIHVLLPPRPSYFGVSIRSAGDVNLDGFPDIVVGAGADPTFGLAAGAVHVFSGQDASILHTFYGDGPMNFLGWRVSGAGDLDGDGYPDIIASAVSCPFGGTQGCILGYCRAYSMAGGSVLYTIQSPPTGGSFGISISGGGDVNGDGTPDIVVGGHTDMSVSTINGMAKVFSGKPLALSSDGFQMSLTTGGDQTLRLNAGQSNGGSLYFLLGSVSGTKPGIPVDSVVLPLNADGYLLFTLSNPNKSPLSGSLGILSSTGTALAHFGVPAGTSSSLAGITAFHAYVLLNGPAITFASNAVPVTLVP